MIYPGFFIENKCVVFDILFKRKKVILAFKNSSEPVLLFWKNSKLDSE